MKIRNVQNAYIQFVILSAKMAIGIWLSAKYFNQLDILIDNLIVKMVTKAVVVMLDLSSIPFFGKMSTFLKDSTAFVGQYAFDLHFFDLHLSQSAWISICKFFDLQIFWSCPFNLTRIYMLPFSLPAHANDDMPTHPYAACRMA